jgi:hypothetical protein
MAKPIMGTSAGATQRRIILDSATAGTVQYIDTSRLLSQVNHRLYRQQKMYCVRVGILGNSGDAQRIQVKAAPNTWAVRKGLLHARQAYNDAMRKSGVKKRGRWADFRVKYNVTQYTGNQDFATAQGLDITDAENLLSLVAGDSGTSEGSSPQFYGFHILGATSGANVGQATASYGVVSEYSNMEDSEQNTPPDVGTTSPYSALSQDAQQASANVELAIEDGDNPPYNPINLQVQEQEYWATMLGTSARNPASSVTPWIVAPSGLLTLTNYDSTGNDVYIEVMAGKYKGVLAEDV